MSKRQKKHAAAERRHKPNSSFAYLQTTMVSNRPGNEDATVVVSGHSMEDDHRRWPHYQKQAKKTSLQKSKKKKPAKDRVVAASSGAAAAPAAKGRPKTIRSVRFHQPAGARAKKSGGMFLAFIVLLLVGAAGAFTYQHAGQVFHHGQHRQSHSISFADFKEKWTGGSVKTSPREQSTAKAHRVKTKQPKLTYRKPALQVAGE